MQGIVAWIVSIVGICLMSVIIDVILPSGSTSGSIKKVISYAIILIVLAPIPNLLKTDVNIDTLLDKDYIEIQDNYIYNLNQIKLDKLKNKIQNDIDNSGILGTCVSISANVFESDLEIYSIYVDLFNLVISNNAENINIKKTIKQIILSNIDIEEEKIVFYGGEE